MTRWGLLGFGVVLVVPALASAQRSGDDLARAHFDAASAYYESGEYDEAAREFLEAYELSQRPMLLENVARSEERALRFDDAIATLDRLAELHPEYAAEARIAERRARYVELRDRLGRGEAGDGGSSGAPEENGGGSISVPGIIVLSIGGALGIASIATGVASQVIYDGLATDCGGAACPANRASDVDTGEALALTSTILMFPSIIAIGVGIVLLIVDSGGGGGERARLRRRPLAVVSGPGDAGLAVEGTF
ncbi:MAG: tol-pal system YbgF family protein [Sandaracinaceae bacterium]